MKSFRPTRCVDGRTMRHDPQHDDPELETDIGQCEECDGKGCIVCEACEAPTNNPEDAYGEHICDDCLQNRDEAAWERHCTTDHTTLRDQQIAALRFK